MSNLNQSQNYHSLPHPQEHEHHYGGGRGRGGGHIRGGNGRHAMMSSFKSFQSGKSGHSMGQQSQYSMGQQSQRQFNESYMGNQSQRRFNESQAQFSMAGETMANQSSAEYSMHNNAFDGSYGYITESARLFGDTESEGMASHQSHQQHQQQQGNYQQQQSNRQLNQSQLSQLNVSQMNQSHVVPTKAPSVNGAENNGFGSSQFGGSQYGSSQYGSSQFGGSQFGGSQFGGGGFNENQFGGFNDGFGTIDEEGTADMDGGTEGGEGGSGGPRFRAPITLDGSNRSQTSDLSDRTPGGGRPRGSQGHPQQQGGQGGQGQQGYYQGEPNLIPVEEDEEYYEGDIPANIPGNNGAPPDRRAVMSSFTSQGNQSQRSFHQNQSSRSFDPNRSSRSFDPNQSGRSFSQNQSGRSFAQNQSSRSFEVDDMYQEEEEDLPVSPLRQLLDAINMSILPTSLRLSSLAQAVEFFDHRDRAMHDAELREGGAFVLYHKLGLVLRLSRSGESVMDENSNDGAMDITKKGLLGAHNAGPSHYLSYQQSLANSLAVQQQTECDKEIAMICSCLEMVHRANPDAIAQAWDECGTEILPLLVHVLERPFQKIERAVRMALREQANVPGSLERAVAMAVTRDQKLAVQKVTKVLAMYSLVPEAKKPMCECTGMLRWLTRIIDTHNYNRVKPGAPVFGGTTGASSGGASLSGMDGGEDAKAKRLELAARATSGSGLYMTEAARFNTIATLTNLAALEANRMSMLHEAGLLDNICRAVHNERSDVPKQCSALAIMNLSNGDMDHVPEMARNDLVLETLLKLMKEENPETRRNAVVTIFNVACSDQNTVRLARYRDGTILEALIELVGSDDPVLRTHDEARANAAETIFNMSCSEISETTDRMANHAGLLECLAVTLRGEHTGLEVKMYCSATLRRMAELIKHPMIAQGALLSALVKAATWTNTDCIAEAFRAQASFRDNCVIMAHHHGLLNALSRLALTREGADVEKVRMASCLAIELMSRHDEARALLSQNEGIIMALTKASYGEEERDGDLRESNMSELEGSVTGFMDTSGKSEDDLSLQSRRIQVALKNLVGAM